MTEDEARKWLNAEFDVSRETEEKLDALISFLKREAQSQNLISASTMDSIWDRHIVDSAQLLRFCDPRPLDWIDLGSGAGFPGIVIALLSQHKVTLVESRGRRIEYLHRAVALLDLEKQITVAGMPLERVETGSFDVISARAFAPLQRLFELAERFSTNKTLWLLPKGRNAAKEWEEVQPGWSGEFHIEPSVTDNEAGILVGYLTGPDEKQTAAAAKRHQNR